MNGARTGANNYTVDGADINDSGSNGTLLNTPSIDAIREFTLERSNYDAAFGRSGGGQIVVATKSGTNHFHGSAYEFNRNNYYNANTFSGRASIAAGNPLSSANTVPIERYNDFGFTFGGPVYIPKLYQPQKDKTFFFWSEEWRKASTPGQNIINVPTPAELAGSFASPVTVAPAGCVTTAGRRIHHQLVLLQHECHCVSERVHGEQPSKYFDGTVGYELQPVKQLPPGHHQARSEHWRQGACLRPLYGGRSSAERALSLWGGGNYPGVETTSVNAPGRNLVVNASFTISPKVVNEVEYVDAWGAINSTLNGIANSPSFLSQLTNNTKYTDPNGRAPNVGFSGGTQAVPALTGLGNGSAPYFERNIDKNIFDNLSIQHGNHTIRMGATAMWMQKTENASSGFATFTFSPTNGNPAFANFLLGQADSYKQPSKDTIPHLNYVNFEAYVQDDWKVTPRLTVNAGVRWSYFPSPTDSNNTLNSFDPASVQPGQCCGDRSLLWKYDRGDCQRRPDKRSDLCQRPDLPHGRGLHGGSSHRAAGILLAVRQPGESQLQQQLGTAARPGVGSTRRWQDGYPRWFRHLL